MWVVECAFYTPIANESGVGGGESLVRDEILETVDEGQATGRLELSEHEHHLAQG